MAETKNGAGMSKLERLLSKQMTRRQFLTTLGLGATSVLGFSSIVGLLSRNEPKADDPADYGMRNYGP